MYYHILVCNMLLQLFPIPGQNDKTDKSGKIKSFKGTIFFYNQDLLKKSPFITAL